MASISTKRAKSFKSSSFSSSNTFRGKYDVFLSFSGVDTRDNFLEYLYRALLQKGILTFRDNDKLKEGEDIKGGLTKAIEESSFSILVLSANYASSSWCLDELVHILQCMETVGHIVYPVFYRVAPSEVRKIEGKFGEGFAKIDKEMFARDKGKVEKWKKALSQVANLKGWDFPSTRFENEAKLIDDLVHKIFNESIKACPNPVEDLVGIRYRMMKLIKLLDLGSDGTRVVGLWGMGGIGKTTLAKAVYQAISWQFEGCSFVENVRELTEKSGGVLALQEQLISDIVMENKTNISSTVSAMEIITNRVCRIKSLIVLDDMDESIELKKLVGKLKRSSPGSRIIITTRDKRVLTVCREQDVFNVQGLKKDEAIQLFTSKAFAENVETGEFIKLIDRAVNYADGVPLALEVLGSFLLGKTVPEWASALARLTESPDDEVQRVLRISYDGLHWTEKEIFLDISCFFNGQPKKDLIAILDGCGLNPVSGINVLVEKSLLTISEVDNKCWMHDLVVEMGRSIVVEESRKEPGRRSRLCRPDDGKHVLTEKTGTKKVESILVVLERIGLSPDAFLKMTNLRVLIISCKWCSVDLPGFLFTFGSLFSIHLPNKLRVLYWERFPLKCMPSTFQPEHLVTLTLVSSRIEQLWKRTMELPKLKTLSLPYSTSLIKCPDLTGFSNLESLDLTGCTDLVDVHPSIKKLKKLSYLNLKNYYNLKTLPHGIGSQCLQTLIFSGCLNLNNILENFEHLNGISQLDLDGTGITKLHHSIGDCTKVVLLDLSDCTQLESIPTSIGQLQELKELWLNGCSNLTEVPEEVGNIDSLELLDVSFSGVRQLPDSVTQLRNLKTLDCKEYKGLPPSFSGFKSLETLNLCPGCLEAIPESISFCPSLKEFSLSGNDFEYLPKSIKNLSNLETLFVDRCQKLQELPDLPSSILKVDACGCKSLKTISSPTVYKSISYGEPNLSKEHFLWQSVGCFCQSAVEQGEGFCRWLVDRSVLSKLEREREERGWEESENKNGNDTSTLPITHSATWQPGIGGGRN